MNARPLPQSILHGLMLAMTSYRAEKAVGGRAAATRCRREQAGPLVALHEGEDLEMLIDGRLQVARGPSPAKSHFCMDVRLTPRNPVPPAKM